MESAVISLTNYAPCDVHSSILFHIARGETAIGGGNLLLSKTYNEKMIETILRRLGRVCKREGDGVTKKVLKWCVLGKINRGNPKKKTDTKELEVNQQARTDNADSYTRSKVNVVYIGKR